MSMEIFDLVRRSSMDSRLPTFPALPNIGFCMENAWNLPFVFRYEPQPLQPHVQSSLRSSHDAFHLSEATELNWPSTLEKWRLCEVSRLSVQSNEIRSGGHAGMPTSRAAPYYREVLCACRCEVVATVFAVERYQLLAVPVAAEEVAALRACGAAPGCAPFQVLPTDLAVGKRQAARLLGTVCRILSNVGGTPPSPEKAAARILNNVEGGLGYVFFRTWIPLLGVTMNSRQQSWRKVILESSDSSMSLSSSELGRESKDLSAGVNSASCNSSLCVNESTRAFLVATTSSASDRHVAAPRVARHVDPLAALAGASKSMEPPPQLPTYSAHWQWQLDALPSLFRNTYFTKEVTVGWRRWTDCCKGALCRASIVNSIDDIVQYCECSRAASYTAVAYLDRFVALTTEPLAVCESFLRCLHPWADAPIDNRSASRYFMQVIVVCAMLGCKNSDSYPPRVEKMLTCMDTRARLTRAEFAALELQVVRILDYQLQPVTVNQVVELLLYLGRGDELQKESSYLHYCRLNEMHHARDESRLAQVQQQLKALLPTAGSETSTSSTKKPSVEWRRFCYLARFVCDLMIRGRKETSRRTPGDAGKDSFLAIPPVTLGIAIIAVTSEVLRTPLPEPLFELLPESYKALLLENHQSPVSLSTERRTVTVKEGSPYCKDGQLSSFPLRESDEAYVLLKQFCRLAKPPAATHSGRSAHDASNPTAPVCAGTSVEETVDSQVLDLALSEVHACYELCRNEPCDKILRRRYGEMFNLRA